MKFIENNNQKITINKSLKCQVSNYFKNSAAQTKNCQGDGSIDNIIPKI